MKGAQWRIVCVSSRPYSASLCALWLCARAGAFFSLLLLLLYARHYQAARAWHVVALVSSAQHLFAIMPSVARLARWRRGRGGAVIKSSDEA